MRGYMCVVAAGLLLASGTVWAGRPLTIDDADPVAVGQFEFEAGLGFFMCPGAGIGRSPSA